MALDLTLIDTDYKPFWNEHTANHSQNWWYPRKIDCVDLDSNLLNGSWQNPELKCKLQYLKTYQERQIKSSPKILSQLSHILQTDIMKNVDIIKNQKIPLILTNLQKRILMNWMGMCQRA